MREGEGPEAQVGGGVRDGAQHVLYGVYRLRDQQLPRRPRTPAGPRRHLPALPAHLVALRGTEQQLVLVFIFKNYSRMNLLFQNYQL